MHKNNFLAAVRRLNGFSQQELAKHLKRSQARISRLEHGLKPGPDEAVMIGRILGVSPDLLFDEGR